MMAATVLSVLSFDVYIKGINSTFDILYLHLKYILEKIAENFRRFFLFSIEMFEQKVYNISNYNRIGGKGLLAFFFHRSKYKEECVDECSLCTNNHTSEYHRKLCR